MERIQWGTFLFFAGFVVVGFVFAYFFIPETSGLTLEEMDILFAQGGSARQKRRGLEYALQSSREPGTADMEKPHLMEGLQVVGTRHVESA